MRQAGRAARAGAVSAVSGAAVSTYRIAAKLSWDGLRAQHIEDAAGLAERFLLDRLKPTDSTEPGITVIITKVEEIS